MEIWVLMNVRNRVDNLFASFFYQRKIPTPEILSGHCLLPDVIPIFFFLNIVLGGVTGSGGWSVLGSWIVCKAYAEVVAEPSQLIVFIGNPSPSHIYNFCHDNPACFVPQKESKWDFGWWMSWWSEHFKKALRKALISSRDFHSFGFQIWYFAAS